DWRIGSVNLTSITAWRDWTIDRNQDIDFNLIDITYRYGDNIGVQNFTQEFRLQGETGRVNWLVGLFYSDETVDNVNHIQTGQHYSLYGNALAIGATLPLAAIGGPAAG